MGLKSLFQEHLQSVLSQIELILQELKLDGLVIGAGQPRLFFEDDQEIPYRSNHHFRYLCPLEGASHLLIVRPGQKPLLRVFQPEDFWHEVKPLEADFWTDSFVIETCAQEDQVWADLFLTKGRYAYHGPDGERAEREGCLTQVESLLPRLNWLRLKKTPYEQQCLIEATRRAAQGHKAAERCFRQGGSELAIHFAYLQAVRCREQDLPYENIVCLNEKSAILHYSAKRDDIHNGRVLLIDAGAQVRGYAADITRTYATDEAAEEFRAILADMETLQQAICASIRPGIRMNDLHFQAHERIAQLLIDHRILLNCDVEKAVNLGLTAAFFPHGLGHMLGLLVHDVAGKQVDAIGTLGEIDPRFPRLRTHRPLDVGTYVTIEPGLYFIRMLLDPHRKGEHSACFNWGLIERLAPCGGIRIEDNILINEDGIQNLTRLHL